MPRLKGQASWYFSPMMIALLLAALLVPRLIRTVVDVMNLRHALAAPLPRDFEGVIDAEKFRRSQEYLAAATRFSLVSRGVSVLAALVFWLAGGFGYLDAWARGLGLGPIATALVFFAAFAVLAEVLSLSFSYFHTFHLEERFGFNRSTRATFWADTAKGWALGGVLGGAALAGILWFFLATGDRAWIWAWAFVCAFQVFVLFLAPVVIMPLFNKFQPLADGELRAAIEGYAKRVGFQLSGIFSMDGSKRSARANAFFTGFGRFRRIVLFDTLIDKHTVPELVAILAHEVGHYQKKHILKQIVLSFGLFLGLFWLLAQILGWEAPAQALGFPEPSLHAGLVGAFWLFPPLSMMISVAFSYVSRRNEFEADAFARETTGGGKELIEALRRLSVENLSNLNPHPWKVALEYSHPPVTMRIARLRA